MNIHQWILSISICIFHFRLFYHLRRRSVYLSKTDFNAVVDCWKWSRAFSLLIVILLYFHSVCVEEISTICKWPMLPSNYTNLFISNANDFFIWKTATKSELRSFSCNCHVANRFFIRGGTENLPITNIEVTSKITRPKHSSQVGKRQLLATTIARILIIN